MTRPASIVNLDANWNRHNKHVLLVEGVGSVRPPGLLMNRDPERGSKERHGRAGIRPPGLLVNQWR